MARVCSWCGLPDPEWLRSLEGLGSALKPAIEPVIVARKPIRGTVAANVLAHGTGGINVDGCRVGTEVRVNAPAGNKPGGASLNMSADGMPQDAESRTAEGRFPPNVLLDPEAAAAMDAQSGVTRAKPRVGERPPRSGEEIYGDYKGLKGVRKDLGDTGGASRFFPVFKYQAKAPAKERPQYTAEDGRVVKHATVKPLELMRWLVRLVTPAGGVVLDPFAGSGTTGEAAMLEGFDSILIEGEAEHLPLIDVRIARVRRRALLEALREADSRSSLEQIFYQDASSGSPVWSDDCTAASKERLKDLARKDV